MAERIVSLTEVKALLEKAEAARGELTYEQKLALEHARKFAKFTPEALAQCVAELRQNAKIDESSAARVCDVAPVHTDDVRALFAKTRVNLDDAEVQKILQTVAKYAAA